MHRKNPRVLDQVCLTRFSAVGDGMHVELASSASSDPLLTFREDERLGLQVVMHLANHDVVFPLAELKRALAMAEQEVHKESFYDHQEPNA